MEPSHRVASKGDDSSVIKSSDRMKSLAKLASMSLGLKNRSVLHCLGVWLHRQGKFGTPLLHESRMNLRPHYLNSSKFLNLNEIFFI
jgi:hypothetical protein